MKLIVISPETEDPREHAVLANLFGAGLVHYHLRKPSWSREQLSAWLRPLPESFHSRIVLHTHHDLATEFAIGGLHDRDQPVRQECHLIRTTRRAVPLRSRAVHTLSRLRDLLDGYDRLLLSPLFASISKPSHGPAADFVVTDLRALLALPRCSEVIALGGIDVTRIQACRDLGFDGVAVLGAVWQATDPVHVFNLLNRACRPAHAV